jgi:hypothetical protein
MGVTPHSDGVWMVQVAKYMCIIFGEEKKEFCAAHIIRDRDSKFTDQFCAILESEGGGISARSYMLAEYESPCRVVVPRSK